MISIKDLNPDVSFEDFLVACKIPYIGQTTAEKVANRFRNINTFRNFIEEGTIREAFEGTTILRESAIKSLEKHCDIDFLMLLEDMEEAEFDLFVESKIFDINELNLPIVTEDTIFDELPSDLNGTKISITGTLSMPRRMFQQMIQKNNGVFSSGVDDKLDVLVYSDLDGEKSPKYKEALKLNKKGAKISIVSEKTFVEKFSKKI